MNHDERARKLNIPRLMLAAAGSGSGKTLFTCGLLQVLRDRGLSPVSYKCGPDYIDPMFHEKVLGITSRNLDTYFMSDDGVVRELGIADGHFCVIEGVMGLYDGISVSDTSASCYEIASVTDTPIILIVDMSGVGRTVISEIKGILGDDRKRLIRGVILNRITPSFYERLAPCMERELADAGYDVMVAGYVPRLKDIEIQSRHLGLTLPDEIVNIREQIGRVAKQLELSCDIGGLIGIMEKAADDEFYSESKSESVSVLESESASKSEHESEFASAFTNKMTRSVNTSEEPSHMPCAPVLAVAYDEAFCFYYKANLELLRSMGAEIRFFSPIHDKHIPDGTSGLLIGGGYPELYLNELSANLSMRMSILDAIDSGMPSLAECGGFMYLHKYIEDMNGDRFELVGAVEGSCFYTGHPVRFGYMSIDGDDAARGACGLPSCAIGMRGHEFHYFDSTDNGGACIAVKASTGEEHSCMIGDERSLWGFPHFYYGSKPEFAEAFVSCVKKSQFVVELHK